MSKLVALAGFGLALMLAQPVFAQQPVVTYPSPVTTKPSTTTIGSTSVFQLLLPYNGNRFGGWIQNDGSGTMYVFMASRDTTCANATAAKSVQLAPPTTTTVGDVLVFQYGTIRITDAICVTGTGSDALAYAEE